MYRMVNREFSGREVSVPFSFRKGEYLMKMLKEMKWDALLQGILYIVLGAAALIIPETMEKTLGYLIGIVLILVGAVSMVCYLLRDAHQNYYHNDFVYGLVGIVIGCAVLYKVELMISLIPFILGMLVLASGCTKLQDVIDMKRMEYGNWVIMLVLAVINLILGILLICNPFEAATVLFQIIGIGLVFSGLTDCVVTIYFARKIGNYLKEQAAVEATFAEVEEETAQDQTEE